MRGLLLGLVVMVSGCAETSVRGRDILRTGPFRDTDGIAAAPSTKKPRIDAGTNVLTDDELKAARLALRDAFSQAVTQSAAPGQSTVQAELKGCQLDAGSSRKTTVYRARCRALLRIDKVVFVIVEARAERRERARAITSDEAEELKKSVRDFTLDYDKSVEVMNEAARFAALRLLAPGRAIDQLPDDEQASRKLRLPDAVQRDNARKELAKLGPADAWPDKVAALGELARYGRTEDVPACARHQHDPAPRVRAGVGLCLGELLAPEGEPVLQALSRDPDPGVAQAAALGLKRWAVLRARHTQ